MNKISMYTLIHVRIVLLPAILVMKMYVDFITHNIIGCILNAELAHQMTFIRVNVDQIDTMPSDGNPVAYTRRIHVDNAEHGLRCNKDFRLDRTVNEQNFNVHVNTCSCGSIPSYIS